MSQVMYVYCPKHYGERSTGSCKYAGCDLKESPTGRIGKCFYCGDLEPLSTDHVIPKYRGRMFRQPWNCVRVCLWCNHKKDNLLLAKWFRRMEGSSYQHEKYKKILARQEEIVRALLVRPEMRSYRSWIEP